MIFLVLAVWVVSFCFAWSFASSLASIALALEDIARSVKPETDDQQPRLRRAPRRKATP